MGRMARVGGGQRDWMCERGAGGLREDLDTDNCLDDGVGDLLADGG